MPISGRPSQRRARRTPVLAGRDQRHGAGEGARGRARRVPPALDANKLGYEVGVRINIDVLNAQTQLADTLQKLARARYDTLLAQLRLKAAGTLARTTCARSTHCSRLNVGTAHASRLAASAVSSLAALRAVDWKADRGRAPRRRSARRSGSTTSASASRMRRPPPARARAPARSASCATAWKLKVCGPITTAVPTAQGLDRVLPAEE